jgi:virginiamycin A acetyltransferase
VIGPIVIKGKAPCTIGNYCAIGDGVRIITSNHTMNTANMQLTLQRQIGGTHDLIEKRPVVIGSSVWIGDAAIVLPGVTVGDGAVIGAGAVVTKDVRPFSVVAGCPAREIRRRFSESMIVKLLAIRWWDWEESRILRNKEFFNADLSVLEAERVDELIEP